MREGYSQDIEFQQLSFQEKIFSLFYFLLFILRYASERQSYLRLIEKKSIDTVDVLLFV